MIIPEKKIIMLVQSARNTLDVARQVLWAFMLIFCAATFVYLFYGPTASTYTYTFQLPPSTPGNLISNRWDADFFFTGSLQLLWLVPLTAAFMSDKALSTGRRYFHIITTLLLLVYFVVILIYWGVAFYSKANLGSSTNAGNPANDNRWCCIYYSLPGSQCVNTVPCPGIGAIDLVTNGLFLWKFWWLFVFLLFMVAELVYVFAFFQVAVTQFNIAKKLEKQSSSTNTDDQEEQAAQAPPPPPIKLNEPLRLTKARNARK